MKLRVLSVVGEALNFGARRMETIMRVAWLPVMLLLILNMATLFGYLSVFAGRAISFADVPTLAAAEQAWASIAMQTWSKSPALMGAITIGSLFFQTVLVASFMAPLIRYAGLGERPGPGVIRLPFGADQIRFILAGFFSYLIIALLVVAPLAATTYYIILYLVEALSQTVASFPDPNSLHTIELITVQQSLVAKGTTWLYDLAIPMAVIAPFLLLIWLGLFFHFHPRNRSASAGPPNSLARLLICGGVVLAMMGAIYYGLADVAKAQPAGGNAAPYALFAVFLVIFLYVNTRLYPYTGVVVCRKSMAPSGMLQVTRGWNLIRLMIVLALVTVFLTLVQFVINSFILGWILSAVSILFSAVSTYTRLLNSGVTGEWVAPFFIWVWSITKILINIFWTFFSYGAIAGLYGRLYRESERGEAVGT